MNDSRIFDHLCAQGRMIATPAVVAVAASLMMSLLSAEARADPPANTIPKCTLSTTAVTGLVNTLAAPVAQGGLGLTAPRVDFVVIYTLNNPNDGQTVSGGFTGPVLCVRPAIGSLPAVTATAVPQTEQIPSGSGAVDLLGIETALITQYRIPAGDSGDKQKRFCHSVGEANDCYNISD